MLIFVKSFEIVGKIENREVYTIREIDFLPLSTENFICTQDVRRYMDGIQSLFHTGFYYSFDYDITQNVQALKNPKNDNQYLMQSLYYHFNFTMKKPLIDSKVHNIFITNLLYGYVGISNSADLSGEEVQLILISRRSRFFQGTFFESKGIDEQGNCANFVETELIMKLGFRTFSYVQYRGSPPLFIRHDKLDLENPIQVIERSQEMKEMAINKHIERITDKEKYNLFILNLLSDNIREESQLNKHLSSNLFPSHSKCETDVKYLKFDLNHIFESKDLAPLDNFAGSFIKSHSGQIHYFCEDSKYKSSFLQKGVVRINDFSTLDRANVMQAALAWKTIEFAVTINK